MFAVCSEHWHAAGTLSMLQAQAVVACKDVGEHAAARVDMLTTALRLLVNGQWRLQRAVRASANNHVVLSRLAFCLRNLARVHVALAKEGGSGPLANAGDPSPAYPSTDRDESVSSRRTGLQHRNASHVSPWANVGGDFGARGRNHSLMANLGPSAGDSGSHVGGGRGKDRALLAAQRCMFRAQELLGMLRPNSDGEFKGPL